MNVYIGLIIWILFLWFITESGRLSINGRNIFIIGALGAAFIIMALRGESVGVDTKNYKRYFEFVSSLKWKDFFLGNWDNKYFSMEKGYMILQKFISIFLKNSQWTIVIGSGIYMYCSYRFIYNNCKYYLFSVILFLSIGSYLLAMNVMRQSIAVGICCLAWDKYKNNKFKSLLYIIFASFFHTSSLVFLVMFLIKKIPSSKKVLMIIAAATVIFSILGEYFVRWVIQYFPVYSRRYGKGMQGIADSNGIIILWCIMAIIILLLIFWINWNKKENHYIFEILAFTMAYLGINVLGQTFDGLQRLSMYFSPFLILLFEEFFKYIKKINKLVFKVGVFCTICFMCMLFVKSASTKQYIYTFFWS